MFLYFRTCLAVVTVTLVAGVGCYGAVEVDPGRPALNGTTVYQDRVGTVTLNDLATRMPRVLGRHGYVIEHQQARSKRLYFETQWKSRAPLPEERAVGVRAARTRIVVRGSWVGRFLYSVQFYAENHVRVEGTSVWRYAPLTDDFREYAEAIARDMHLELANGLRRF